MGSSVSDIKKQPEQEEKKQLPEVSKQADKVNDQNESSYKIEIIEPNQDHICKYDTQPKLNRQFTKEMTKNTLFSQTSFNCFDQFDNFNEQNNDESYTYTEMEVSYDNSDLMVEEEQNENLMEKKKDLDKSPTKVDFRDFEAMLENEKINEPIKYELQNEKATFIQKIFRENLEQIEKKNHGPDETKGELLEYIPSLFKDIIKNYQSLHGSYLTKLKHQKPKTSYDSVLQGLDTESVAYTQSSQKSLCPDNFSSKYISLSTLGSSQHLKRIKLGAFIDAKDGSLYLGEWHKGKKYGEGFLVWSNGSIYEGYFENDCLQGKGRLQFYDVVKGCPNRYEGDWYNSKMHGFGDFINNTKKCYFRGEWEFDMQHGHGIERYADKSKYDGCFEEGKKNGKGAFYFSDGSTYHGTFKNDMISGNGEYRYLDGRIYSGEFDSNYKEGVGVFLWPDGRMYEGCYIRDNKEGYGKMTWPDGKAWEGGWKNGKQHGYGNLTDKNGKEIPQLWAFGKLYKEMCDQPPIETLE